MILLKKVIGEKLTKQEALVYLWATYDTDIWGSPIGYWRDAYKDECGLPLPKSLIPILNKQKELRKSRKAAQQQNMYYPMNTRERHQNLLRNLRAAMSAMSMSWARSFVGGYSTLESAFERQFGFSLPKGYVVSLHSEERRRHMFPVCDWGRRGSVFSPRYTMIIDRIPTSVPGVWKCLIAFQNGRLEVGYVGHGKTLYGLIEQGVFTLNWNFSSPDLEEKNATIFQMDLIGKPSI